jgi:hypothetical protein
MDSKLGFEFRHLFERSVRPLDTWVQICTLGWHCLDVERNETNSVLPASLSFVDFAAIRNVSGVTADVGECPDPKERPGKCRGDAGRPCHAGVAHLSSTYINTETAQ